MTDNTDNNINMIKNNNIINNKTISCLSLTSEQFRQSVYRYLDETKPDPLARKQVENWGWCWDGMSSVLEITGDYTILLLFPTVEWNWNDDERCGSFDFSLRAKMRFVTKNKSANKIKKKIISQMISRFRKDDYINKLLLVEDAQESVLVCEASVKITGDEKLEERVSTDEDILEAIRRSLYSQADTPLTVAELLLAMPYLDLPAKCPLGHRARLSILEQSMLEQCEREGENDLLEELRLGEKEDQHDHKEEDQDIEKDGLYQNGNAKRKKRR